MELWTVQLGRWRLCKARSIDLVDTTVKTGNPLFAPTWDMVWGHKNQTLTDEDYEARYRALMAASIQRNAAVWLKLCHMERVAIACYCGAGRFCHRRLLVDILKDLCTEHGISFTYHGELS